MIKILIVDDSATEREILKFVFQSAPDIQIVGFATNGAEAVKLAEQLKPDLITMDIHMPYMDGYDAIKLIMSKTPIPIVVISSYANIKELNTSFRSLEAGALSVVQKPFNINSPRFVKQRDEIIHMVRMMAEVKVIKRRIMKPSPIQVKISPEISQRKYQIVAIGTSVGGPQALKVILSGLHADFPVPIVVVQHMTRGFLQGFSQWLDSNIKLKAKMAEDNEVLLPGFVYFAPDQLHFEIRKTDDKLLAHLSSGLPVSGFCPSATVLLKSVAEICGKSAVGILLTGMGSDGAEGLLAIKQAQGHTLIQDPASTVVFGMGGVAQSLGAVDKIVELNHFSDYLNALFNKQNSCK